MRSFFPREVAFFAVAFMCSLLFVFSATSLAQSEENSAPVVWERFKDKDRKVSVLLPKLPTRVDSIDRCREVASRSYYAFAENAVYTFNVSIRYQEGSPSNCASRASFDETFAGRLTSLRGDKDKGAESSPTLNGLQTYKFANEHSSVLVIPDTKNHRWIELGIAHRPDANVDEERFIHSLDLSGHDGKEIGAGSKNTLGDSNVDSSGAPLPPSNKAEGDGLIIISKPRANYTDAARKGNVQGVVRLKVTFLSNGGIGSVTVEKELPLGLTEQAVSAAKRMCFLPRRVNKIPVSIVRTVEYSFTIYYS